MAGFDHGPCADDPDPQFGLPRCHVEVLQSDNVDIHSFKMKIFRLRLCLSESDANEYLALLKIIFWRNHRRGRADSLYALLPSLEAIEYLDLHPQIVNGNFERLDDRKTNGIFLGGDDRADITANASLQKLAQLFFRVTMVVGEVARQLDFRSQIPQA